MEDGNDNLLTRVFSVTTTREKIISLSDYLNDNEIDFDKVDLEAADLCKTDLHTISNMLEYGAKLIEKTASKPREADKARQFKNMIKKINKKLVNKMEENT